MRHFQMLALALLAVIALELGSINIKLPTPPAQAQQVSAPIPGALTTEHLELKKQLDALASKTDARSAKVDAKVDALATNMKNYDEKTRNRFVHLARVVYFCTSGKTPNSCDEEFKKADW